MQVEQLTGPICDHGEGAAYSERWGSSGAVRCVDMLAGDVVEIGEDGSVRRRHVDTVAAVIRPRSHGGFLVAGEHAVALADDDDLDADLRWCDAIVQDPGVRLNEGGCGPDGAFYVGSMAYDEAPGAGSLFRIDPGGGVETAIADVTISNGLAWNADDSRVFYADTPTGRIDVFEWPDRGMRDRKAFASVESPDGVCTDEEGGVWVARYGFGRVERFDADGRLDAAIEVPAAQVTSVAFAGPGLDRLVITTSRYRNLSAEPQAGALFSALPGVRGVRPHPFAG